MKPLSTKWGGVALCAGVGLLFLACTGKGNVDLSKATPLTAEPVATPKETPVVPNPLFNYAPGTAVSMKSLGTVDGTGTSLITDYDGDGIPNQNETTSNKWVSDYPVVEASIAPPVTMKVQILTSSESVKDDIVSQINSDDYEDVKQKGTEKLHQNEVNARTTMVQDWSEKMNSSSGSTSSSSSSEANLSIGFGPFSVGGGGSSSSSREESWSNKTSYGATKTEFPTVPFKNNLDRDAISVKSDSAARNARKYRSDKGTKKTTTDKILPNAGSVRAALYIKNLSVNMPVHLTNILCTLMFESNSGQLIPVQSFRLRNDDYSLFSVNVYGGSEFGPYVVDLPNLNTAEIERALQLGFNPKIFIVDYDMTHVPNSNYKNVLTSYQGDNLKIVEENAKGRTALVKIKGPQMREMYRVAAFSTSDQNPALCTSTSGIAACPGIPMRTALQRIRDAAVVSGQTYTATNIEYADYIFDFSQDLPRMPAAQQKVYLRGIKTIGSISSTVPCDTAVTQPSPSPSTVAAAEGVQANIQVCRAKPFAQWSASEKADFGLWVVFANGKFYNNSQYEKTGSALKTFTFNTEAGTAQALVAQGIDGTVWAGDNYDLVYITLEQFLALQNRFGNNPMETGEVLAFNTKWDLPQAGENMFDPTFHSRYIGQAALGDKIEIKIQLNDSWFLNPNFGTNYSNRSGAYYFSNFDYPSQRYKVEVSAKRFNFEEMIDFEINFGQSGSIASWANILRNSGASVYNDYEAADNGNGAKNCGKSIDYLKQEATVCVQIPANLPNIGSDGKVNVYVRPILANAYRNSFWPENFLRVNKFQGTLVSGTDSQSLNILVQNTSGSLADIGVGNILEIADQAGSCQYVISAITSGTNSVSFAVSTPACNLVTTPYVYPTGTKAYIRANLTKPQVAMFFSGDSATDNFAVDWNSGNSLFRRMHPNNTITAAECNSSSNVFRFAGLCYGTGIKTNYDYLIGNWLGGSSLYNNWASASLIANIMQSVLPWENKGSDGNRMGLVPQLASHNSAISIVNLNVDNLPAGVSLVSTSQDNKTIYAWIENVIGGQKIFLSVFSMDQTTVSSSHIAVSNVGSFNYLTAKLIQDKAIISWVRSANGAWQQMYYRIYDLRKMIFITDSILLDQVDNATGLFGGETLTSYELVESDRGVVAVWETFFRSPGRLAYIPMPGTWAIQSAQWDLTGYPIFPVPNFGYLGYDNSTWVTTDLPASDWESRIGTPGSPEPGGIFSETYLKSRIYCARPAFFLQPGCFERWGLPLPAPYSTNDCYGCNDAYRLDHLPVDVNTRMFRPIIVPNLSMSTNRVSISRFPNSTQPNDRIFGMHLMNSNELQILHYQPNCGAMGGCLALYTNNLSTGSVSDNTILEYPLGTAAWQGLINVVFSDRAINYSWLNQPSGGGYELWSSSYDIPTQTSKAISILHSSTGDVAGVDFKRNDRDVVYAWSETNGSVKATAFPINLTGTAPMVQTVYPAGDGIGKNVKVAVNNGSIGSNFSGAVIFGVPRANWQSNPNCSGGSGCGDIHIRRFNSAGLVFQNTNELIKVTDIDQYGISIPGGQFLANGSLHFGFTSVKPDNINATTISSYQSIVVPGIGLPSLPFGLNNFFTAPLIERNYSVTAKVILD